MASRAYFIFPFFVILLIGVRFDVPFLFIEQHDRFISIHYMFDISALSAISIRRLIDVTISVTVSFEYIRVFIYR